MKAVILAGGYGTRISEESHLRPKPMIEIGGKPILWHIMKTYSHYGINDFVICLGYKGYVIKEYFANYFLHMSDVTIDVKNNKVEVHHQNIDPWRVTMVDTGEATMTGGRLKRVQKYLNNETFCFTYGDGLSDVPIDKVIEHHKREKKKVTITAIQPPGRYGVLDIDGNNVSHFNEKPAVDGSWINGGFFVAESSALDTVEDDSNHWELKPMQKLTASGQVTAYKHTGFWQAMDTLREKNLLEDMWAKGNAPWKVWA